MSIWTSYRISFRRTERQLMASRLSWLFRQSLRGSPWSSLLTRSSPRIAGCLFRSASIWLSKLLRIRIWCRSMVIFMSRLWYLFLSTWLIPPRLTLRMIFALSWKTSSGKLISYLILFTRCSLAWNLFLRRTRILLGTLCWTPWTGIWCMGIRGLQRAEIWFKCLWE